MAPQNGAPATDRYVVISADGHAGAEIHEYRDYLERRYLDDFDRWVADYVVPFPDLEGPNASRNWDSARRLRETEADGIVAEVLFPNTVPPFYPRSSLTARPPAADATELELRWAGLRAHNRWLADFCAAAPGRRAGIAQILLADVDAAVAEVRWARDAGLTGGMLLPGAPPGTGLPPLYSPAYEPLWSVCQELGMPVNHHSGSAVPPMDETAVDKVVFLLEVTWWAHRAFAHLVFGGVLERYPELQLVLTEQGTGWIPDELARLDYFFDRMRTAVGSQEVEWGSGVVAGLSLKPSGYWARQCHVGASFIRPTEVPLRHEVGVNRIMWGCDYPHKEASYPYSQEALRLAFANVDEDEVRAMVGANAAGVYRFDLDALAPIAARVGPRVADVARPIAADEIPDDARRCPAFAEL
ncbi:MAG TPA: amidohydrolase family protein [Acidimicrobiia bacterium]|jgi:predicted TIM-barrel fold metal-dependent hydrolase|nr:amidohydrolase family protein [Acidimicrobiia bacterium]